MQKQTKIKNLEKDISKLKAKKEKLLLKKDEVVTKQFLLDDENKTHTSAYYRLVDMDFSLAVEIELINKQIKNKKSYLNQLSKKDF